MQERSIQIRFKTTTATLRGTETVIGRSIYCTIVISDPSVSRVHASLTWSHGDTYVRDLGSKNGTYLNGLPVGAEPQLVKVGDSLRVGDVTCLIEEHDPTGRRVTSDHPTGPWDNTTTLVASIPVPAPEKGGD
jgi:pSer/pThr/pTyr-binding forkhead associated (FHA) protein